MNPPSPGCKPGSGSCVLCVKVCKTFEGAKSAYNIGMKPSVGNKLPILPATNVHASHYQGNQPMTPTAETKTYLRHVVASDHSHSWHIKHNNDRPHNPSVQVLAP